MLPRYDLPPAFQQGWQPDLCVLFRGARAPRSAKMLEDKLCFAKALSRPRIVDGCGPYCLALTRASKAANLIWAGLI